jgi:molecular chaperone GrpE (heat shock protein)
MNWRFWEKRKASEEGFTAEDLHKELDEITEQITKLTRLQYKTSKKTEDKMDKLTETVTALEQREDLSKQFYGHRQNLLIQHQIRFLDDMDHVFAGLQEHQQTWYDLLRRWSERVIESLHELEVYELDVLGKNFDPAWMEALKTVPKESLHAGDVVPYQVVDVIKRGFVRKDGTLLRKAQVITVEEEKNVK